MRRAFTGAAVLIGLLAALHMADKIAAGMTAAPDEINAPASPE